MQLNNFKPVNPKQVNAKVRKESVVSPIPSYDHVSVLRSDIEDAISLSETDIQAEKSRLQDLEATIDQLQNDRDKLVELDAIAHGKQPKVKKPAQAETVSSAKTESLKPGSAEKISKQMKTRGPRKSSAEQEATKMEILQFVRKRQGDATPSDIAAEVKITPVNAGKLIASLESDSLVKVSQSDQDKRKKLIDLSVKGAQVIDVGFKLLEQKPAFPAPKADASMQASASMDSESESPESKSNPEPATPQVDPVKPESTETDRSDTAAANGTSPDGGSDGISEYVRTAIGSGMSSGATENSPSEEAPNTDSDLATSSSPDVEDTTPSGDASSESDDPRQEDAPTNDRSDVSALNEADSSESIAPSDNDEADAKSSAPSMHVAPLDALVSSGGAFGSVSSGTTSDEHESEAARDAQASNAEDQVDVSPSDDESEGIDIQKSSAEHA